MQIDCIMAKVNYVFYRGVVDDKQNNYESNAMILLFLILVRKIILSCLTLEHNIYGIKMKDIHIGITE